MNHTGVRAVLKKEQARTYKSRQGRPQGNYPETVLLLQHRACSRVVVLMEANTLRTARSSCATLKCLLWEKGYNCCAEAVHPAKQLHSRCDFGEVQGCLATFFKTQALVIGLCHPPTLTIFRGLHCITTQQLVLSPQPERGSLNTLSFLNKKPNQAKKASVVTLRKILPFPTTELKHFNLSQPFEAVEDREVGKSTVTKIDERNKETLWRKQEGGKRLLLSFMEPPTPLPGFQSSPISHTHITLPLDT